MNYNFVEYRRRAENEYFMQVWSVEAKTISFMEKQELLPDETR